MANIESFKNSLGAGSRPSRFRTSFGDKITRGDDILCKAASLPEKSISVIELFKDGRKFPVPGEIEFTNTWTATFYNDEGLELRSQFEKWIDAIDTFNGAGQSGDSIWSQTTDISVSQLKNDLSVAKTYTFHNAWPSSISSVELADETVNTISEFTVTFTFSHWE
jgi:hypothetical protein